MKTRTSRGSLKRSSAVLLMLTLGGCAHIQAGVDTVCGRVAQADHLTARAITASAEEGVPDTFVDRYLVPIGQAVLEAHSWCFNDPGDAR